MSSIEPGDFQEYLKNPILFPDEFKSWLNDYIATNIPKLHVSQVFGFKLQSVKEATEIAGPDTLTSDTYVSFATDGPTFSNVPNGYYLLFFGATFGDTASGPIYDKPSGFPAYIAPIVDGGSADDGQACLLNAGTNGRVTFLDLSSGTGAHSITFKFKKDASMPSGVYQLWNRWAYLLKVVTDT